MEKFRKNEIKNVEEKIAELEKIKRDLIDAMRKDCTHDEKIKIYRYNYDGNYIYCKKCGLSESIWSDNSSDLYKAYKNKKLVKYKMIINGNCRHLNRVEIVNDTDSVKYKCTECDLEESDTDESVLQFLYKIDEYSRAD